MHRFVRFPLIVALLTLCACAQAASPFRLAEIGTARFVEKDAGQMWLQRGLYSALGAFRISDESPVLSIVTVPAEARNKVLVSLEAWFAYERLGPEAVVNFVAATDGPIYTVGARQYITVAASPNPKVSDGKLVNISTRGRASVTEKLIGGFVVDEQHRWVLLRAVGPTLAAVGVTDAMPDPFITLYKGQTPIYFNGDWGKRPDASDIAAAAVKVGAFPLAAGSKDSALLVELPPGAYTAHVEAESGNAGTVLLEVYSVPSS